MSGVGVGSQPHLPRFHRPSVTPCVYCGLAAYSVIEVRFARTVKYASMGVVDDEDAPREVIARGYYVCDGCLALLDYRVEHHLSPRKHSSFNALSVAYHAFMVWSMTALGSLAGFDADRETLITTPRFLYVGMALAVLSLIVWFFRATVHSRYFGRWLAQREVPVRPRNSLAGFTALRDRVNPELAHYLPVRFNDSAKILNKAGSPPLRSLGPSGEPWGDSPPTNFPGSGENEWYRLIWNSWQLWPLSRVEPTEGWQEPPQPKLREFELAVGTVPALSVAILLVEVVEQPWWLGLLCGLLLWPVGLFVGLSVRQALDRRRRKIDTDGQVG
jgi:hypothetical protein